MGDRSGSAAFLFWSGVVIGIAFILWALGIGPTNPPSRRWLTSLLVSFMGTATVMLAVIH